MDGLNSPLELVQAAKAAGQTSIAITDHGTLSSHREMQIACREEGVKPILGVEAYISPTDRFDKSSKTDKSIQAYNHIILLAKNKKGLENINTLQEIAWNEGFYHKPRIDREILNEYSEGIIVLSGCLNGLISKAIEKGEFSEAKMVLKDFQKTFGKDFYVEVKSPFTYDVLMGRASYSKERDSNPDQLKKLIYVSKNVKKIRICIVDGEFLNYLDL
jgi:DNA polymerase-3 subunit alpha